MSMKDRFRSFLFVIIRNTYYLFVRLAQPVLKRKHRLNLLLVRIKGPVRDFLCPPPPHEMGGSHTSRPDESQLPMPLLSSKASEIPEFIIKESIAIHAIEPMIFPFRGMTSYRAVDVLQAKPLMGMHYMKLRELMGDGVSHILLVPWMKQGGADIVTINYASVLAAEGGASGVVVITTEDSPSPWASKLGERVRFVEFGRLCNNISPSEQEKLLARIILQVQPSILHILNSDLGFRMVEKYGKAVKSVTTINVSVFCADFLPSGQMAGCLTRLVSIWDSVSSVYCDTTYWRDRLISIYAFEPEKMHVHYQPIDLGRPSRKTSFEPDKSGLDILWASRIDNQKRPDILIEIARRCQDLPFTFHVYGISVCGTSDAEVRQYMNALTSAPNIKLMGEFNGTNSLPIEKFDVFLYTSQWDGIPIVLLEAMSLGLPIVASSVGGVPEVVIDGQTGFLVNPYDDVSIYVSRLIQLAADRSLLKTFSDNAYTFVCERHNMDSFVRSLKNSNYLQRDSAGVNP